MQAVIMAGGRGERLRPLTTLMPKPLVPLFGRPLLAHLLDQMPGWGITEAIITVGYRAAKIREALEQEDWGLRLRFVEEEHPLGTAGGVRQALPFLEETFLVLSGDGLLDIDVAGLVAQHRDEQNAVTLCLSRPESGLQFGLVEVGDHGVERFVEKPRFADVFTGQGLNTGVYVVERRALARVPEGQPYDFSHDLFPFLLAHHERIGGRFATRYWRDVGTIPSYLEAHWDVLEGRVRLPRVVVHLATPDDVGPGVTLTAPVSLGPGTRVGSGAVLTGPLVVGPGAQIDAEVHLSRSVLWEDVRVGHGSALDQVVLTSHTRVAPGSRLHGGVVMARRAHGLP
jgi:mannose-1-phosphate guanylyltransferase/phosphomannomutase